MRALRGMAFAATAALGALLLAAPADGAGLTTTATALPSALFGIHPGPTDGPALPQGLGGSIRLWDTGTQWPDLQPSASSAPDFAHLDAVVDSARASGVTDVLLVLGMTPAWASSNPAAIGFYGPTVSTAPPRSDTNDLLWRTYVRAVARHAASRYPTLRWSFQAWNEASLASFYTGTPERLAVLTALADREVKAVNPAFTLVAASTTTRLGIPTGSFFPRYLTALRTATGYRGRLWPVDAFSVHSYPDGQGTPAAAAAGVGLFQRTLAAARAPARPVWITEINYGLAGPHGVPGKSLPGRAGAEYLARTYLDAVRLGVARVYWYAWRPAGDYLGVTTHPGTPATAALLRLRGWIAGWARSACTLTTTGVHRCTFTRTVSGRLRTRTVLWTDRTSAAYPRSGTVRVCPAYGSCAMRTGRLTITGMPVLVG